MNGRLQRFLGVGLLLLAVAAGLLSTANPDGTAAPPTQHKAYKETIPDSKVSFDMVPIPAGTFTMGSPKDEKGRGQ